MKKQLFGDTIGCHDIYKLTIQECALVLGELNWSARVRKAWDRLAHSDNIEIFEIALKLDKRWSKLDLVRAHQFRPISQDPLGTTTMLSANPSVVRKVGDLLTRVGTG